MLVVVAVALLVTVGVLLALVVSAGPTGATTAAADGSVTAPVTQTTVNSNTTVDMAGNGSTVSSGTLPGWRLSAVIGVQDSETNGELEHRSFDACFVNASSNVPKATVVTAQVETVCERLTGLEQRRDRLEAQRENRMFSEDQYRVRLARTVADIERTWGMLNQTTDAALTVPTQELSARGVETAEFNRFRTSAGELTGPEVAEIARGIVGNPGRGIDCGRAADETETDAGGRPGDPGRSGAPGNSHSEASDRAADARADTRNVTSGTETDGHAASGTMTDVAGGESGETADGAGRDSAPKTPPENDKRARDADGGDVAMPLADERSDSDTTVTDDDMVMIDDDVTDDESETSSTDGSGV